MMMIEKELIGKIRELRQIKPSKDWVVLTKSQILSEEKIELTPFSLSSVGYYLRLFFGWRLVHTGLIVVFVLFGLFGLVQNSLPGDFLYPIKKFTEKSQALFVSEKEKPKYQLEQANKRLEELGKIAQENDVKKLAPAINEFQESISQAAKNLKTSQKINKEIIDQTKKIVENRERIEKLGVVIENTEELENALKELVEREIKDLEKMDLSLFSEEKVQLLEEAKEYYEAGNYPEALIKILMLSQNR
jgi:hypothetical protein